jgi:hypothetical protein
VKKTYQGRHDKSKQKFEVIGKREIMVEVPLPMVEVWEELQAEVEQLTGEAGLRIIGAILENEVTRRVGPQGRNREPCAGGVSRVTWCLADARWPSNVHGCARGKAGKWN